MTPLESDPVLADLARREAEMLEMLGRLVSIDSGSYDKAGVDAVGAGRGTALLMGHRDTVFPPGTAAARPFRVEGGVATGPGVADMKATADAMARVLGEVRAIADAADVGLTLDGEATGGSADSGFAAAAGAPMLCGTGPVGGNPHRTDEFCRVDTLVPRARALALAILRPRGAT